MRGILARQMANVQVPLDVRESLQAAVGTLHAVYAHLSTYFKPRPASQAFYMFSVHDLYKASDLYFLYLCCQSRCLVPTSTVRIT